MAPPNPANDPTIQIQWPPADDTAVEQVPAHRSTPDTWVPIPLSELLRRLEPQRAAAGIQTDRVMSAATMAAALLAGLAAGWQWFPLRMIAAATIDPLPSTTLMLAVVALLAAAVAPWLPMRFLPSLARAIEQRRGRSARGAAATTQASLLDRVFHQHDETLFWAAAAILSAVAGAAVLLMLSVLGWFAGAHERLLERFFWTGATLRALEWVGTVFIMAPPWVLNSLVVTGMILAASRRLSLRLAVISITSAWAMGFGMAGTAHQWLSDRGVSGDQQIMLGIAPMFLVALLLCILAHRAGRQESAVQEAESTPPRLNESDRRWIQLSVPAWGLGVGLTSAGWLAGRQCAAGADFACGAIAAAVCGLSFSVGMALCWLSTRRRTPEGPACGMVVWAAGLGAGVAATLAAYSSADWSTLLQLAALAGPAGFSLCHLQTAWLARATSRGQALAQIVPATLGSLAVALVLGRWGILPLIGPAGVVAAGALLMLTFGGLAQIYSEDPTSRTRHLRLGLVFASLAGAIAVFPRNVRQWSGLAREAAPPLVHVDSWWLARHAPPGARRFCLIGVDLEDGGFAPAPWEPPPLVSLSFSYPPTSAGFITGPRDRRRVFDDACSALRLVRGQYDLIYQHGPLSSAGGRFSGYSLEWLAALARHRGPGGRVILDVPLAGLSSRSTQVIAHTFEQALGGDCRWAEVRTRGGSVLRLQSGGDIQTTQPGADEEPWRPVDLLTDKPLPLVHSLRRDQISRTLGDPSGAAGDPLPAPHSSAAFAD